MKFLILKGLHEFMFQTDLILKIIYGYLAPSSGQKTVCKWQSGWFVVSWAVNRYRIVETNSQGPATLTQILI